MIDFIATGLGLYNSEQRTEEPSAVRENQRMSLNTVDVFYNDRFINRNRESVIQIEDNESQNSIVEHLDYFEEQSPQTVQDSFISQIATSS